MVNGHCSDVRPAGAWRARTRNGLLRASVLGAALVVAVACSESKPADTEVPALDGNRYVQTNLAANKAEYQALFTFPDMVNAWGLADRPKGAGGHFWVGAGGKSFQFVGDVTASADPKLQKLFQDPLKIVTIPGADADTSDNGIGKATGVLFNPAPITSDLFVVRDQPVEVNGARQLLSGSARFIFATDSGKISGWTEQAADGTIVRQDGPANLMFDGESQGMQFFGIALSPSGDKLLAADFGEEPQVRTLDKNWQLIPTTGFVNPFATGDAVDAAAPDKGKKVKPGDPAPFNVSTVGDRVFVAYATTKPAEADPAKLDVGEEDSLDKDQETDAKGLPDKGKVAEFDADGKLVRVLDGDKRFNAPWAVTVAPAGFGPLSGKLLIGNFGGAGYILAFDDATGEFVDYLRDAEGKPVAVEGLWALMFGNGESLGDADSLYFTAGPEDEKDGLFGKLRLK
ncbi:TIGR03118 family protein [Nocardia sp. CS682]|uniref:TIGR03118 family protein n=1 Tax=Nocardia sp. CS682 TaxID=1047172 RepID=UPI00107575B1|nr:TIGR03118 family protein [Nocardia sp. CS682]QBS40337.1 TIGR03118 family protein [Nocardia sp. CS682]